MKYADLGFRFEDMKAADNFDKIMKTKNIYAGLIYLSRRTSSIREKVLIDMIAKELRKGDKKCQEER